jgi:hypothetical protein
MQQRRLSRRFPNRSARARGEFPRQVSYLDRVPLGFERIVAAQAESVARIEDTQRLDTVVTMAR